MRAEPGRRLVAARRALMFPFHHSGSGCEKGVFKGQRQSMCTFVARVLFMNKMVARNTVCELCKGGAGDEAGEEAGKQTAGEDAASWTAGPQGGPGDSALQPQVCSRSHYAAITPTPHSGSLVRAGVSADWRVAAAGRGGGGVTEGVKGNEGSIWMEIKVEILDCENCHSGGHVQSLFA